MNTHRHRLPSWLASVCLTLWLVGHGHAQAPMPRPTVILFVGNSFLHGKYTPVLHYNAGAIKDENFGLPRADPRAEIAEPGPYGGIPGIFKKFTEEAGVPYDVHLEAVSAKPLEYHYAHALPLIAQPQWDAVVLQDYSSGPLPEARGGKPGRFFKYATLLEQAVHGANPRARVYLYENWPRADLVYPAGAPYAGESVDAMTHDLRDAYTREFTGDGHFAGVLPVGEAWLRAIQTGAAQANPFLPGQDDRMDLWAEDDYHPSAEGAYLATLVVYQRITGKDARGLGADEQAAADLGIDAADAVKLQEVASAQVMPLIQPAPDQR